MNQLKRTLLLCFLAVLSIENTTKAQVLLQDSSCTTYNLSSFKVRFLEEKVYVMWVVREPSAESLYLLERSNDNVHYKPLFSKQGTKSPSGVELLNCYVDEAPVGGISYYRIKRFSTDGCITSEAVKIVNGQKITSELYELFSNADTVADSKY